MDFRLAYPRLELVTAPVIDPVFLEDAKDFLREDEGPIPQDTVIEALIASRCRAIENATNRALITQTWRAYFDRFPCAGDWRNGTRDPGFIDLPKPPLQAVVSIKYIAQDGTLTTIDPAQYVVQTAGLDRHIRPAYSATWPTPRDEADAVRIEFRCGYGDLPESIPADLLELLQKMLAGGYETRESLIVGTIVARNPDLADLIGYYHVPLVV